MSLIDYKKYLDEVVKEACRKPSLKDALAWIATAELENVLRNTMEGKPALTSEACFRYLFDLVEEEFKNK